jgi:hypothetical protein
MPLNEKRHGKVQMDFGSFIPPDTIILDDDLPNSDYPLNIPELAKTLTYYSAVREVIHASDHIEGNSLLLKTRSHILQEHKDKLRKGMEVIEEQGGAKCINDYKDLSSFWALQYVDVVTHYKSYIVLRFKKFPKIEDIWSRLLEEPLPPNLLTCIERHKDMLYIFELFTEKKGRYCIIEAFQEYQEIKEKQVNSYTV